MPPKFMPTFWFLAKPDKSNFQNSFSVLTFSFWEQSSKFAMKHFQSNINVI